MSVQLDLLADRGSLQVVVVSDEFSEFEPPRPETLVRSPKLGLFSRILANILSLCGIMPVGINPVGILRTRHRILKVIEGSPDVIWCYGLPQLFMVPRSLRRNAVLYVDIVDFEGYRDLEIVQMTEARLALVRRFLRVRNVRALRNASCVAIRRSKRCFISSETDRQALAEESVEVLPNALRPFSPSVDRSSIAPVPTFLFVGTLGYFPNADAVDWLVDEIWPLVRLQVPDAVVRVVGRGYSGDQSPSGAGVVMVGGSDDLRSEYCQAWAALIPLRVGSGTRLKALEAWANHVPVVSTTKGVEGLGAFDGDTVFIADTAQEFVDRVVELARESAAAEDVATRGYDLWRKQYTTEAVSEQLRQLLDADLTAHAAGTDTRRRGR